MSVLRSPTTGPLVRLTAVTAGYGGRPAVELVDLEPPEGRLTVLLGPNGAGKSTLLAVLAGILRPTGGHLERRPAMTTALVVQRSAVSERMPLTVREVVSMGRWRARGAVGLVRAADRRIVDDALDALRIGRLARRSLHELSGGQRQRALVAQALAQRADLVLLDEPASGVDDEAQGLIRAAVDAELDRGATVVQATHDAGWARRAEPHGLVLRMTAPAATRTALDGCEGGVGVGVGVAP
ncbi:zinc ABC transporter ATP-binding protein AztA [Herbiconiux sp. CPCC 205716]|uniref:Zinc ABC transporter ATP-binding protein AztA n=1 Tax=Herbiconiux gentiana TaxID=2970912 RepID=A0ABT2GLC9_9MICO|nr:zinc ABC transporter ATP-binding protein AztA [Herbiconiux gentiana]MCS5715744.1 zinc ABC transporter ATP-binding protein AztA [Herbiconiux gentiana]